MRRSQSVRRALYALVVLVLFMVVLRSLRPESSSAPVISYEQVAEDVHAQQHGAHESHDDTVHKGPILAEDAKPAGPAFDAEAAYKDIVYGAPNTPLVIFSKSYCPHSNMAKHLLLDEHSIEPKPKVVELDLDSNGAELQEYIASITGRRTVPNILVNGISRGGASDMVDLGDQLAAKLEEWGSGKLKAEALRAHIMPN